VVSGGSTATTRRTATGLLQLGRHVPAVSIVIDAPERIVTAFAVIDEFTREQGLVTSETVPALRAGGRGGRLAGKVPSE
jgi:PII-like signaling protein